MDQWLYGSVITILLQHCFYVFIGCHTVSLFGERGAWNVWKVFSDVTKTFKDLLLLGDSTVCIETFVVY